MKNLPNFLTVIRIFFTFVFIYYLQQPDFDAKVIAAGIFILASITDLLDGVIARKYNLISNFGKIMDPIADKFLTLAAFFVFARLGVAMMWMVVLIAIREIGLTLFRFKAMGEGKVLAAEKSGKYKTVLQMVSIIIILFISILRVWPEGNAPVAGILKYDTFIINSLMTATLLLTLYSGITNFVQNRKAYGY